MSICDSIEKFIMSMLEESENYIELQRNDLAQYFGCAPSQITYVLSTRFTLERGFDVQSRKGGGGCIRIVRVDSDDFLTGLIIERIGESISAHESAGIIRRLYETQAIGARVADVMLAATRDKALKTPGAAKDFARAGILKEMILSLIRAGTEE